MSITAKCDCGKRTSVANSLAGATVRCGSCGRDVLVGAASTQTPAMLKANRQKVAAGSAVSINPAIVLTVAVGVILLAVWLALYLGPWAVGAKWAAMSARANNEVTDVVDFAIKAYESEHFLYDPAQSHVVPMVQGDAIFVPPMMAFSMPRRILVSGKTNQGNYLGTYDTTDGEVTLDIEFGGYTVGGLLDVKKASGSFHTTGREKDGKVSAEADGHSLQIVMRKSGI